MTVSRLIKRDDTVRPLPKLLPSHVVMKSCYLCGSALVDPSREHVVAKSVFSPNALENPLILKACLVHNQAKRKDDEYSSLLVQATSDTKDSAEAFAKSLSIIEKKFKESGPVDEKTPGVGLVMGMRKNVRDLPYIKQNGILRKFDGGELDIDSPRYNNFFINIAKGLLVMSTEKIYSWENFAFKVIFDHTIYAQIPETMKPAFDYVVLNSQFAEKWEDALFVAGINSWSQAGKIGSLFAVTIFSSHVALVSVQEQ